MYAVTKANVRSGPDASTESLGKLEEGEKIFAVELTEEGWYKVVFQGETGYVRGDLLEVYGAQTGEDAVDDEESQQWMSGTPIPEDVLQDITDNEENTGENEQETPPENLQAEGENPDPKQGDINKQPEESGEGEKESGGNISTFVILAAVVIIILIYGAVQIVKEKRQEDGGEDEKEAVDNADETENAEDIEDMEDIENAEDMDEEQWYDTEEEEDMYDTEEPE